MTSETKTDRLQKILAHAGVGSRRYCETLISEGRVSVDGKIVLELGAKADPGSNIQVDGLSISLRGETITLIMNKPSGFVTTMKDPQGRPTVTTLIPKAFHKTRLYPVGRLDMDTTGLLLLTNDGDLAYRILHPKHELIKWYEASIEGRIGQQSIQRLRDGVLLTDGLTAPAQVLLKESSTERTVLSLGIHEGRKRQVRRMLIAVRHPVLALRRVAIGSLQLGDLPLGQCRELTKKEIFDLLS